MSEILGKIFGFGDQIKRNLRDAYKDPAGYLENVAHQNNIEWKKDPIEKSVGFFNPVPLGTMGNFVLRKELGDAVTNLSRRDFLKKSAGIAGGSAAASIPGAKLLQKFAPEERAVVKEIATEAAPKYKYNSLKDYLDDVSTRAEGDILMSGHKWDDALYRKDMRERLLQDELAYKEAKRNLSSASPKKDSTTGLPPKSQTELIDSFSPQAKKEMKEFKSLTKQIDTDYTGLHDWTKWATNNMEDPSGIVAELKRWYIP